MDRLIPRRRGMRRKGERSVAVLGTEDLFKLLDCYDIDALLARLDELGVHRYVSGYGERRHVSVSDDNLPEEMRERGRSRRHRAAGLGKDARRSSRARWVRHFFFARFGPFATISASSAVTRALE